MVKGGNVTAAEDHLVKPSVIRDMVHVRTHYPAPLLVSPCTPTNKNINSFKKGYGIGEAFTAVCVIAL